MEDFISFWRNICQEEMRLSKSTQQLIVEEIKSMTEEDVKLKLAELMINYSKIGYGGYTKENCFNDYQNMYKNMVVRNIFKKST